MLALRKDKVRYPAFFKLEKNNKISYLLGCNHVVPLESLPEEIISIISTDCDYIISENFSGVQLNEQGILCDAF